MVWQAYLFAAQPALEGRKETDSEWQQDVEQRAPYG
jgi:hypothetical protein